MEKFSNVNELVNKLKPVNPVYCIRPDTIKIQSKSSKINFQVKYCMRLKQILINMCLNILSKMVLKDLMWLQLTRSSL